MDGLNVCAALQQDCRTGNIPVFAVSADALPEDIAKVRAAGVREYFTKPLDLKAFQNSVRRILTARTESGAGPDSQ